MTTDPQGVRLLGARDERHARVLGDDALGFVAELQRRFGPGRLELLESRRERQGRLDAGEELDFLPETHDVRCGDWQVAAAPPALSDRRVEITGPTERKMLINALNSGARVFMADFEDANSPTWANMAGGQANLIEAVRGTIAFTGEDGREYALEEDTATIMVRPRGWHLPERHLEIDGAPVAGALFDFGLALFHNAHALLERGAGPYFYLPKLESHLEARLWNDVFCFAEDALDLRRGDIRATVLIETLPAAFEMDEILFELREHSAGLNAGRWDYMFSMIKTHRDDPAYLLPDRNSVTMTVPFMRAYAELVVATCHRRGAHAIGGMAAFIPSRRQPEINERAFAKVSEDKEREAAQGFDGTWVAHPDLVAVAREQFDAVIGERPNQLAHPGPDVRAGAPELLDAASARAQGEITEEGLRNDINVGIQYISSWLRGNGAAAIFNLMEDAATAEIARSQVWQWVRHGARLPDGRTITAELVADIEAEELEKIRAAVGDELYERSHPRDARELFHAGATGERFTEFLTVPAYARLSDGD